MRLRTLGVSLLAIVFLLMVLFSTQNLVGQNTDLSTLSEAELQQVRIQFERTQCYGTCPAYTLTVHGDGLVEYTGKAHVKQMGKAETHVGTTVIRGLLSEFTKAKFLSVSEDYSEAKCKCRRCTDMTTVVTELSVRDQSHRVIHYHGCACAPRELFDLENAIDKAVSSEQWTGDVSKQGPFGTTCFGG